MVNIPVFVDFSKFNNPQQEAFYNGTLAVEYIKKGNIRPQSEDFYIKILPDTKTAALSALFSTNGYEFEALKQKKLLQDRYTWKGKKESGKTNCFWVKLHNIAEAGSGGIQIQDFAISFYLHKDSISTLLQEGEDLMVSEKHDLSKFFLVNDELPGEVPTAFFLTNKIGSSEVLNIGFRHNRIAAIPKNIATIICNVSFKYRAIIDSESLDTEEAEQSLKPFNAEVEFKIERYTGNQWLALDFGTSATVAAYTDGTKIAKNKEDDLLVDLQKSLITYVNDYEGTDINEKGTPFLSSEIILRPSNGTQKAFVESTSYHDDIVMMSPSVIDASENIHYKIPFLKSLIGLDTIPVFYEKLNEYQYHIRENGEKRIFKEHPLEVNTLLSNVYNSLIRDFISPQIGIHEQLDKIIFTVPNTFTPKHLDLIRGIIQDRFPKFRRDYVEFISESDAVACNYLLNREYYNFERQDGQFANLEKEHVLVYDIGAGTTDITYFSIHQKAGGKKEVEIIGRLGKSTAGNYLDYKIAKVIDVEFESDDRSFNFTEPNDSEKQIINEFKVFIRNYIKPKLSDGAPFFVYIDPQSGRISEYDEPGFIPFDCSIILGHHFMEQYFERNSEELISEFFNLFRYLPGQRNALEKGRVPIDTVLFTGRTIQFASLRKKVQQCIKEWSNRDVYFTPVREADDLKNVVVKGALQFALHFRDQRFSPVVFKNRNLLARYGILYKDPRTFKFVFKEFLNPSTLPVNEDPIIIDGLTIYEYDTDISNALDDESPFIDMSATPTGFFVQSFSSNTAHDVSEANWDYITVMFEFNREEVATASDIKKVRVRIMVDSRNEMKVQIGNFDDGLNAPLRMNLVDNETFKQSMWPYL